MAGSMSTTLRRPLALSRASLHLTCLSWSLIASPIWSSTLKTGFRAFIAPWKIMEISFQRTFSLNSFSSRE